MSGNRQNFERDGFRIEERFLLAYRLGLEWNFFDVEAVPHYSDVSIFDNCQKGTRTYDKLV